MIRKTLVALGLLVLLVLSPVIAIVAGAALTVLLAALAPVIFVSALFSEAVAGRGRRSASCSRCAAAAGVADGLAHIGRN